MLQKSPKLFLQHWTYSSSIYFGFIHRKRRQYKNQPCRGEGREQETDWNELCWWQVKTCNIFPLWSWRLQKIGNSTLAIWVETPAGSCQGKPVRVNKLYIIMMVSAWVFLRQVSCYGASKIGHYCQHHIDKIHSTYFMKDFIFIIIYYYTVFHGAMFG